MEPTPGLGLFDPWGDERELEAAAALVGLPPLLKPAQIEEECCYIELYCYI